MRTLIDQYIIDKTREKRLALKMSQEALSIELGSKSNGFVAQAESPRSVKKYNPVHINKAAVIFHCSPGDFLPEIGFTDNKIIKPLSKGKGKQHY
ncbi:MAG TPA: XRE family transcriptional regulator [Chitinophagaceae bacterium]